MDNSAYWRPTEFSKNQIPLQTYIPFTGIHHPSVGIASRIVHYTKRPLQQLTPSNVHHAILREILIQKSWRKRQKWLVDISATHTSWRRLVGPVFHKRPARRFSGFFRSRPHMNFKFQRGKSTCNFRGSLVCVIPCHGHEWEASRPLFSTLMGRTRKNTIRVYSFSWIENFFKVYFPNCWFYRFIIAINAFETVLSKMCLYTNFFLLFKSILEYELMHAALILGYITYVEK